MFSVQSSNGKVTKCHLVAAVTMLSLLPIGSFCKSFGDWHPDANWHALGVRAWFVHGRSKRRGSLLRGGLNVSAMDRASVQALHRYFFHGFTVAVVMLCIDCSSEKWASITLTPARLLFCSGGVLAANGRG